MLSGESPGGENMLGRRCEEAPFDIEDVRVVPKGLVIGGWVIPTPCGVGWRWGSVMGQYWFDVSKVGFCMYVSQASCTRC